jgi:hypothetical protein
MRYIMMGLYDTMAEHGPITGSGPGFDRAMYLFNIRQKRREQIGKWRAGTNYVRYTSEGTYTDPDWYIVGE